MPSIMIFQLIWLMGKPPFITATNQTGKSILSIRDFIHKREDDSSVSSHGSTRMKPFYLPNGDGVANLDIESVVKFHHSHGKMATVTTVRSPARFGRIAFEGDKVCDFYEKPQSGEGWINGGFFVLNSRVLEYIDGDDTSWEREPLERLTQDEQMMGYRHHGFWSCMDTLKEKNYLEELWNSGNAPWKVWK